MYCNEKKFSIPSDEKYALKVNLLTNIKLSKAKRNPDSDVSICEGFNSKQKALEDISKPVSFNQEYIVQNLIPQSNKVKNKAVYDNLERTDDTVEPLIDSHEQHNTFVEIKRYPGRIPSMKDDETPCDYLNKFSSIFVDNLKDPIPKDPKNRPHIYNKYTDKKKLDNSTAFIDSGNNNHYEDRNKNVIRQMRFDHPNDGYGCTQTHLKKSEKSNCKKCDNSKCKDIFGAFCYPCCNCDCCIL